MASGPITSWQIDEETVADFIFLGSRITADGDCSHEIKRCLLLGRKVMINLDSILKSRDITLPTKVHLVKAMAFPAVMYGCESWTIKKVKHRRIDAFELWCWRRFFPGGSDGKASARNAGDTGSIPGLGRSPGEGNGNPLQYCCLENSMDGGAWWATVHGVAKSRTRLSDCTHSLLVVRILMLVLVLILLLGNPLDFL